jgi:hypothetical protein
VDAHELTSLAQTLVPRVRIPAEEWYPVCELFRPCDGLIPNLGALQDSETEKAAKAQERAVGP